MKEFTVKVGNDTYKRNALSGANLIYLGGQLAPKVIGFGTTINTLIGRRFIENENHYSIFQCIKDIFNAEDWKWLVDTILYDFENPIAVGNRYLTTEDEVNDHFAGDFIRMAMVVLKMGYKNLGEFKGLTKDLNGSLTNIMSYLEETLNAMVKEAEQSINTYGSNEAKTTKKKTTKKQKKS